MVKRLKVALEFIGYACVAVAAFGLDWRLGMVWVGLVSWQYGVIR